MKHVTIKELADQLQKGIDVRMEKFMNGRAQLQQITLKIEEIERNMFGLIMELEPVQSLIYTQHPELERIFESIKRIYEKEDNGNNTEVNK